MSKKKGKAEEPTKEKSTASDRFTRTKAKKERRVSARKARAEKRKQAVNDKDRCAVCEHPSALVRHGKSAVCARCGREKSAAKKNRDRQEAEKRSFPTFADAVTMEQPAIAHTL